MWAEAAVVISNLGYPMYWHTPPDRTGGALPDSQTLWDFIWQYRDLIRGIAHTHPGSGTPGPSGTDLGTFSAIDLALGKKLEWWILSSNVSVRLVYVGPHKYNYGVFSEAGYGKENFEPAWAQELRLLSVKGATNG